MPTSTNPPFTQTLTTGPPNWTTISTGNSYYKSLLRNGLTGAKNLSLPLVSQGALPIDLIRRPPVIPVDPTQAENIINPSVFGQRYFSYRYTATDPTAGPSLRILLSDTAAEITSLPTVTATAPVPLDGTHTPAQYGLPVANPNHRSPLATSPGQFILPYAPGALFAMRTQAGSTLAQIELDAAIPAYFQDTGHHHRRGEPLNSRSSAPVEPLTRSRAVAASDSRIHAGAGTPCAACVPSGRNPQRSRRYAHIGCPNRDRGRCS